MDLFVRLLAIGVLLVPVVFFLILNDRYMRLQHETRMFGLRVDHAVHQTEALAHHMMAQRRIR